MGLLALALQALSFFFLLLIQVLLIQVLLIQVLLLLVMLLVYRAKHGNTWATRSQQLHQVANAAIPPLFAVAAVARISQWRDRSAACYCCIH